MDIQQRLLEAVNTYVSLAQAGPTKGQETWAAWADLVAEVADAIGPNRPAVDHFRELGQLLGPAIYISALDSNMAAATSDIDYLGRKPKKGWRRR